MVKTATTSFRFDQPFLEFLERMATAHGLSKTEVVRQSTLIVGALFAEARANALADLAALRERYGDDAELLCAVEIGSNGIPVGKVAIDLELVDDVLVRPYVDQQAGVAHLYLDVTRERAEGPNHVPFGREWLFVPRPQIPIGQLPWPPRKDLGLKVRLGDLAEMLDEFPGQLEAVELAPVSREIKRLYARLLMTSPPLKVNALTSDDWETIGMSEEEGRALLSRPDFPWKEVIRELERDEFDAKLAEELGMSLELVKEMRKRLYDVAPASHKPENLEHVKA
jgi:hypothetical protein